MSLFKHFFKILSLYLEARIRIKVKSRIRIRIKVTSKIRIRITDVYYTPFTISVRKVKIGF
jgi:hypothetical protein